MRKTVMVGVIKKRDGKTEKKIVKEVKANESRSA